jgi:hypothetical protein
MDVEVVIFWQLTMAVGEVGEISPKMEEKGVGMDSCFSAKVKLDPVTCPEVDELGKTRKTGELDQILAWEIGRQSGRRELVDMHGAI